MQLSHIDYFNLDFFVSCSKNMTNILFAKLLYPVYFHSRGGLLAVR